ncbi:uncharacterized protein IUM83_06875 [Phytophthora cinnamomi]|uniref:uncharacterized protein n=1 Tax=Phytophthora cinnamomi TaxID=4785 RepID=UPI00355A3026|nr:hypothetical protein IUM83_06875 [Phytophthora cinnamomi]
MMIVKPTPPSTQITRVLVEDNPLSVPVLASVPLFDADDKEDALLPAVLLRKVLCDEVDSWSIVALDSEAICAGDGADVAVTAVVLWVLSVLLGALSVVLGVLPALTAVEVVGAAVAASVAVGVAVGADVGADVVAVGAFVATGAAA